MSKEDNALISNDFANFVYFPSFNNEIIEFSRSMKRRIG